MNTFELLSPDGEDITLVSEPPQPSAAVDRTLPLSSRPSGKSRSSFSRLAGSRSLQAICSFGTMQFNHFQGEGYSIWQSSYRIDRSARVIGRASSPVLELTCMYESQFAIDWRDVFTGQLRAKQIELFYAPWVDNMVQFDGPKEYLTLDVHFEPTMLERYVADFPVLETFLRRVYAGAPGKLFEGAQLASPRINAVLTDILRYGFLDSLAPLYYDSYVHLLLIGFLEQLSGISMGARPLPHGGLELAEAAKRLLTVNFEDSLTISELCRELGTNPFTLKSAFRQVHGVSIGRYKKSAFMDYARQLIRDTDKSLFDIAMSLGYNSQQSFTTAYRNHFGYTPGRERRGK
jgi:AraC family transcriptional regulator, transcriptional activator of the genes for pyochelin and ferripyochelin receptors